MKNRDELFCNCCGKEIEVKSMNGREDYLVIRKEWGYFSRKDGELHSFVLCEDCYDSLVRQFRIPVKKEEKTELL